jgi:hypothetical protein
MRGAGTLVPATVPGLRLTSDSESGGPRPAPIAKAQADDRDGRLPVPLLSGGGPCAGVSPPPVCFRRVHQLASPHRDRRHWKPLKLEPHRTGLGVPLSQSDIRSLNEDSPSEGTGDEGELPVTLRPSLVAASASSSAASSPSHTGMGVARAACRWRWHQVALVDNADGRAEPTASIGAVTTVRTARAEAAGVMHLCYGRVNVLGLADSTNSRTRPVAAPAPTPTPAPAPAAAAAPTPAPPAGWPIWPASAMGATGNGIWLDVLLGSA